MNNYDKDNSLGNLAVNVFNDVNNNNNVNNAI